MGNSKLRTTLLLVIAVLLIGVILRHTAHVFIPFAIAAICFYIFKPVLHILHERLKIPRFLAVVAVLILFIAISVLIGYALYSSLRLLLSNYGFYAERVTTLITTIIDRYNINIPDNGALFEELGLRDTIRDVLFAFSGESFSFLSGLVVVIIFLLFMLLEEGKFTSSMNVAFSEEQATRIRSIIRDVNAKVTRYLSTKLMISTATALVVFVGFSLLRVDAAFVWAVLTFLFNFIPSIGSIIITLLSALFVIIQFAPNWAPVIAAVTLISVTEIIFGNIIEPRLLGRSLNINTVIIILSLLIWATIWGVAGMFLAVPLTAVIISVLDAIPLTKSVSAMMVGGRGATAAPVRDKAGPGGTIKK